MEREKPKRRTVKLVSLNGSPLSKYSATCALFDKSATPPPQQSDPEILKKVMLLQQLHLKKLLYRHMSPEKMAELSTTNSGSSDSTKPKLKIRLQTRYRNRKRKTTSGDEQLAKDFDDLVGKYSTIFAEELKFAGMKQKLTELFTLPRVKNSPSQSCTGKFVDFPAKNQPNTVTDGKYKTSKLGTKFLQKTSGRSLSVRQSEPLSVGNFESKNSAKKVTKVGIEPKTMFPILQKTTGPPLVKVGCVTERYKSRKQPLHVQELKIADDGLQKKPKFSALELLNYIVQQPPPIFKV